MLWKWFELTLKYNYGLIDIFWYNCLNHLGSRNFFWMLLQIFTMSIRLISNWKTISLMEYRLICMFEISLVPHSFYIAIILRTKSEKWFKSLLCYLWKTVFHFKLIYLKVIKLTFYQSWKKKCPRQCFEIELNFYVSLVFSYFR